MYEIKNKNTWACSFIYKKKVFFLINRVQFPNFIIRIIYFSIKLDVVFSQGVQQ